MTYAILKIKMVETGRPTHEILGDINNPESVGWVYPHIAKDFSINVATGNRRHILQLCSEYNKLSAKEWFYPVIAKVVNV